MSYLMHEPPSMLDWGLDQVQTYLDRSKIAMANGESPMIVVRYDFDKNRIEIVNLLTNSEQPKEDCITILDRIRLMLSVNPTTGKLSSGPVFADDFFEHAGYHRRDEPKNLRNELYAISTVTVKVMGKDKFVPQAVCKGPLLGKEHYFLKQN